jgi:hypothetical protein
LNYTNFLNYLQQHAQWLDLEADGVEQHLKMSQPPKRHATMWFHKAVQTHKLVLIYLVMIQLSDKLATLHRTLILIVQIL